MKNRNLPLRISATELLGFGALIAFLWADEVLDLPNRLLGFPATPVNVIESVIETVIAVALAGVVMFVSGRSATALALATSERDKLFSIIAHDLRSPFTVLLGNAEIIEEQAGVLSVEEVRTLASSMRESATVLFRLLQDLLVWAQLQLGSGEHRPRRLVLADVLAPVITVVSANALAKKITLDAKINPQIVVYADQTMLTSILQNLLSNAIKFTSPGGRVDVTARSDSAVTEVTVRDTGVGMTPDAVQRLFQIGTASSTRGTAGEAGTGLGLILCHDLVCKHGGRLSVESEPAKGSAFTFSLPNRG